MARLRRGHAALCPPVEASGAVRPEAGAGQLSRAYRLALPSVFLISLSMLIFEVALTRIFSVMLSYYFVFAIVSAAMLGLGAGGFLFKWLHGSARDGAIWTGAFVYSLSLAASVLLILTLPIVGLSGLAGAR